MKKILLFIAFGVIGTQVKAQYIEDFESPVLQSDTAWFGQDQITDGDTIYSNGYFNFELNYNASWGSYTGWAVSSMTDTVTPGYQNQFSAMAGEGYNGSNQYGICYVSDWSNNRVFIDDSYPWKWFTHFYVTNTTYAYRSMESGDAYAKPFGADTNANGQIDGTNGEDWFLLTIYALDIDTNRTGDSVNFYLADFRFPDDNDDYIIKDWTLVSLAPLGDNYYGLDFELSSSDTSGGWGMNTPSYFAMDWLGGGMEGIEEHTAHSGIKVYPNPANELLNIDIDNFSEIYLFDMDGKLMRSELEGNGIITWDISNLKKGVYILMTVSNGEIRKEKLIKH